MYLILIIAILPRDQPQLINNLSSLEDTPSNMNLSLAAMKCNLWKNNIFMNSGAS